MDTTDKAALARLRDQINKRKTQAIQEILPIVQRLQNDLGVSVQSIVVETTQSRGPEGEKQILIDMEINTARIL